MLLGFEQEVVRTVIQCGGVKHLVTMATSEHMIMQNEALVALGLIAALDLGKTDINLSKGQSFTLCVTSTETNISPFTLNIQCLN